MTLENLATNLRGRVAAVALAAGCLAALTPTPAAAWWHHGWGWHHGWYHGWHGCCWGPGPRIVVGGPGPWIPGHWRAGYWIPGHWG